jgi:hypothetical protein
MFEPVHPPYRRHCPGHTRRHHTSDELGPPALAARPLSAEPPQRDSQPAQAAANDPLPFCPFPGPKEKSASAAFRRLTWHSLRGCRAGYLMSSLPPSPASALRRGSASTRPPPLLSLVRCGSAACQLQVARTAGRCGRPTASVLAAPLRANWRSPVSRSSRSSIGARPLRSSTRAAGRPCRPTEALGGSRLAVRSCVGSGERHQIG